MSLKHVVTDLTTGEVKIEEAPPGVDPHAWFQQQVHDCPQCKEARERGEVPFVPDPDELRAMMELVARRQRIAQRRPRWRTLKRKAR